MKRIVYTLAAFVLSAGLCAALQVNVKETGAKGDGSTDDQAAITSAAKQLTSQGGGVLFFPAGTYLHSGMILLGSNVVVRGAGADVSTLMAGDARAAALEFQDAHDCGVESIKIQGAASSRKQNDESADILLKNSHTCSIHNVTIEGGASAGILLHNSRDVRITTNSIADTMADGVHVVGGSSDVTIENNRAQNTGDDSFAAVAYSGDSQTHDVTIRGNTSIGSRARGVTCIGASGCVIKGNTVINPKAHGIVVAYEEAYKTYHPEGATVEDNHVAGVTSAGMNSILIDSAVNLQLERNEVRSGNSVYIHRSTGVQLHGMQVSDVKGSGILVRESQQVTVKGTHISRSEGPAISLDRVAGADLSDNDLEDVRTSGNTNVADIDVANSSQVSGRGNASRHVSTPVSGQTVRGAPVEVH